MINQGKMLTGKLKYLLGILLIILAFALVAGGKLFLEKTKREKSPTTINRSEIAGIIKSLGNEDEFSLEKDGEIVFQNKANDLPEIRYRLVYRYETKAASWEDLREGEMATLEIYYDNRGQIESRILKIYRTEERPTEQ